MRKINLEALVLGNIKYIGNDFLEVLVERVKTVVCGSDVERLSVKKASIYDYEINQTEFDKMFMTFEFDYIIFMSWGLGGKAYDEIKYLDRIFEMCGRKRRTKLIYVQPQRSAAVHWIDMYDIVERAGNELCRQFCENGGSVLKVSVPYLVSDKECPAELLSIYEELKQKKQFKTRLSGDSIVDFLFVSDLAWFIRAAMDEDESGYIECALGGGNDMTMRDWLYIVERSAGIKEYDINAQYGTICFDGDSDAEAEEKRRYIRKRYGWFPQESIDDIVGSWYSAYCELEKSKELSLREKLASGEFAKLKEKIVDISEIFILFLLCEVLTHATRGMELVDFADFRLFFVVIAGTMYGLRYGIAASIAACVMYFISLSAGSSWQIQFYNIINWLPFATYVLTGAIAGYTKDKYTDELKSLQKSQKIIEDKYGYLNELYTKTLENKESFSNQIVNYKNSFGRIYAATKQLNSMRPSEIFYHAIVVLEDMLETQSVAIYSLDGGQFARLNACSRKLANSLTKSLRLSDIPDCRRALEAGETWVNREMLAGQPDYAAGIYRSDRLLGIIVIQQARYDQMSMEYMNRFNIISGLISDTLIRAADYQEMSEREVMLENTKLMKYSFFAKEVESYKQLSDNNQASYILLRVDTGDRDYAAMSRRLIGITRKNDIMGIGSDGKVYVLMTQANMDSMDIINRRFEIGGVKIQVVNNI